jgi:hypothetical protein
MIATFFLWFLTTFSSYSVERNLSAVMCTTMNAFLLFAVGIGNCKFRGVYVLFPFTDCSLPLKCKSLGKKMKTI